MRALLGTILSILAVTVFAQERLSGTNVDVRTSFTFKAPDAAVKKLIPPGWELNSPASGPAQGTNLGMTLIEQVIAHDAEGKAVEPVRGAVISVPVKKTGTDVAGPMVMAGLFVPKGAPGAYGVYLPSSVLVDRRQRIDGDGKTLVEERWSLKGPDNYAIEAQIQYVRGPAARGKTESRVYSGARPDFHRIYRVETVSDVARGMGVADRVTSVSLKVSGEKLAPLFDGTERIVTVTSIPSYSRQVFLTGP